MKPAGVCLVAMLWIACAGDVLGQSNQPIIVLNGGNGMGPEITAPVITMAGGARAVVAVVIHAQSPGNEALDDWRRAQPAEVIPISVNDVDKSQPVFERATLIWFAGGFATNLMDGIRDTYLPKYVRERWARGVVVGGDSAGAMIFPQLILTGDADLTSITAGRTKTAEGLGLIPDVLFDPHFLKRQRLNRLVSLVLDHPDRVGIGADEGTAVVIRGERLEVLGTSNVVVLDARKGRVSRQGDGRPSNGLDMRMHVLGQGMTFDLGSAAPPP